MTGREQGPDLSIDPPYCPVCGKPLQSDHGGRYCSDCEASWSPSGSFEGWDEPNAEQCAVVHRWSDEVGARMLGLTDRRCLKASGHVGDHEHPRVLFFTPKES